MQLPSKKTLKTAAACAAGAALLFFPGSVLMLGVGAALGCWGHSKYQAFLSDSN